MNNLTDQQLLGAYAERRSEAAFAELVRRRVDLVYSAALRMVRDPHLAEDVTQGAFLALAQNASQLADLPVLSGWLHRTAQNLAVKVVRTEVRRRAREQEAVAMNELLAGASDAPWDQIAPHLDAALGELGESDRDALLLRYFERKSAQEMAQALGISGEAAQKRVNRAADRLREHLAKRGLAAGAAGLAAVMAANAVQAAPAALAASITAAATALTATTLTTTTAITTKVIAMTVLQKTLVTAALVATVGVGAYEAQQESDQRAQNQTLQQQQSSLVQKMQELQQARDDASNRIAALTDENATLKSNQTDLLNLRSEVTQLRQRAGAVSNSAGGSDTASADAQAWANRVKLLKARLAANPAASIPELRLLTEQDWLSAAQNSLQTDDDFRKALSQLRGLAQDKAAANMHAALSQYMVANNGQLPTDLSQLQPYLQPPLDPDILSGWAITMQPGGNSVISPQSTVDPKYDSRDLIGPVASGGSAAVPSIPMIHLQLGASPQRVQNLTPETPPPAK